MLALSDDIGHESVWDQMFHQVNIAQTGSCERGIFSSSYFSNCGAGGLVLLRIYVACFW